MTGRAFEVVELVVAGEPVAQGSKRSLGAGRPMIESNKERLLPWRSAVAAEAMEAMNGREALAGPVSVSVLFCFRRPQVHYRTGRHASELKASAPLHRPSKPDLDKLLRAVFDGMCGIVYRDDAQVVEVVARKQFGAPHARVRIWTMGGESMSERADRTEGEREVERDVEVDKPDGTQVEVETDKEVERTETHTQRDEGDEQQDT